MIRNRSLRAAALSAIICALPVAIAEPAAAEPAIAATPTLPSMTAGWLPTAPGILEAMRRDLHLSHEQAVTRLRNEQRSRELQPVLRAQLKQAYAGSWVDSDGTLVVAGTDPAAASVITAAGAKARVHRRTLTELTSLKSALDRAAAKTEHSAVPVWFVDQRENTVVVQALDRAAGEVFVAVSGIDPASVRIETITERPVAHANIRGGDAYYISNGFRCSVGFGVTRGGTHGFVTAGHCGVPGNTTTGPDGRTPQGSFQGSSFPGNDYGWVAGNGGWFAQPVTNAYSAGPVPIFGSAEAPEGAAVCRSGSTTQWRCGTILQRNTTVTYAQGTIFEVVRTNACAEPGDSGGPFVSGGQAQGVLSGGSGNCVIGGTMFFQPVNEILAAYGLTLKTFSTSCVGHRSTYLAPITAHQGSFGRIIPNPAYNPAGGFTSGSAGTHSACLSGAGTYALRLSLERYSCCGPFGLPQWTSVAATGVSTGVQTLSTNQSAGTFRWVVTLEGTPTDFENDYYLLGASSPA